MRAALIWLVALLAALTAACSSNVGGSATCMDGVTHEDCVKLAAIALPQALPKARGNAHADEFNVVLLGFHVFFDSRFSQNLNVRCESCHSVDYGFADNHPVPIAGLGHGARNAPTIFNAARYTTNLWDGRADSLWSQPLFALENPAEMDFTRLEIVHLLNMVYTKEYGDAFGPLPDFTDLSRFPARGAPGTAAYDAMAAADKALVNTVVANLGKALEGYMRKVATGPSVVDAYLQSKFGSPDPAASAPGAGGAAAGPEDAGAATQTLTAQQEHGMAVFTSAGCLQCHSGSALSDNQFHNLGVPAMSDEPLDPGRSEAAIATLDDNPFNAFGPYFDGVPDDVPAAAPPVLGGFRTPSLRNLPKSAPYGHNGCFPTLGDILDFHLQGGGHDPTTFVGTVDPLLKPTALSSDDRAALIEFLNALSGSYPALPWGQWPAGNG